MQFEQVFYINQERFVCQVVENLCKTKGVACYTLDEVSDFSYLLNDLSPNIVVVEEQTYLKHRPQIEQSLQVANQQPPVLIMKTLTPLTFFDEILNALGAEDKKH
jgi:hypothetical protein